MDLFNESKKRLNYFKLFSFERLATIKKSNSHMNLLCLFMLKTFGALHFNNYAKCFFFYLESSLCSIVMTTFPLLCPFSAYM
ncbi:hypothetical protein CN575_12210 [Bacillus wiedmannii]|nr:hypothetical protein BK729_15590 [Bacillus thuringiensis serovar wratislaviensis]PEJ66695.1 hypothetical protein CN685_22630 [Bacillus wiedmannii]PEP33873.1 hypothetical protein CN575_12210 [Bacillus wiedmannii]PFZ04280.1 hypothetical protein COL75_09820 [Bacillus wiedmannii]PHF25793.1 hypothetical protein COF82_26130 [Bacillus wiedmannii]